MQYQVDAIALLKQPMPLLLPVSVYRRENGRAGTSN
jgi:hypothetical protein